MLVTNVNSLGHEVVTCATCNNYNICKYVSEVSNLNKKLNELEKENDFPECVTISIRCKYKNTCSEIARGLTISYDTNDKLLTQDFGPVTLTNKATNANNGMNF